MLGGLGDESGVKEFEGMAVKGAGAYFAIGLPPTLRDKAAKDGAPTVWVCLWKVKVNSKVKGGGQECPPYTFKIPRASLRDGVGHRR